MDNLFIMKKLGLIMLFVWFAVGFASEKPDRGWFFYEDPKKEEKKEEKKVETTKKTETPKEKETAKKESKFEFPVRPDAPEPVKEFLLNPNRETAEKFLAWQYQYFQHLQKVGFALREAYLAKGKEVYPIVGYPESELASKLYFSTYQKQFISNALDKIRDRFGLIVFYSGSCNVCRQELPTVIGMAQMYRIPIRAVNVDGNMLDLPIKQSYNPNLAKQYGISQVPTVLAILQKKDGTVKQSVIGIGLTSADTLLSMIVQFLVLEGEIKGSELNFSNITEEVR